MERFVPLTLLHSNDLHGDFLSKEMDAAALGGISMLSGYVRQTREREANTVYCIAGDMLQGSVIDSEFKGLSTIEIMNLLRPDIASLGNHEVDYGLAHLLFLERCAQFPIINANLFIKNPFIRLFSPYKILQIGGMKVMFIGIITEEIMAGIRQDRLLGSFVNVEDAAREVGKICNAYRTTDIDFTILLTHIGFEEDKKLAALLDKDWGVDVIIGGHSHTVLDQPEKVNDVLIVQAGVGTRQIGRFDIVVDTDNNNVHSYTWSLVPIDSRHCPRDVQMEETILHFKEKVGEKYDRILCRLSRGLTHPSRYQETECGNLFSDALQSCLNVDIMMLGSGSIRKTEIAPLLTFGEMKEAVPYDDKIYQLKVTGEQFRRMYAYMLRDEALLGEHTEFYQFSHGMEVVFNKSKKEFEKFYFLGEPIDPQRIYLIGLQNFHYNLFEQNFGFAVDELHANGKAVVLTTSLLDVLDEYFTTHHDVDASVDNRLVFTA